MPRNEFRVHEARVQAPHVAGRSRQHARDHEHGEFVARRIEAHRLNQIIAEKTSDTSIDSGKSITRSPIRTAIAILLQHPEIYATCTTQLPPAILDGEQQRVLKTLMQQIAENPTINTAKLIETWRDTSIFESLNQLAAWEHQVPEKALANEFIDIVLFLEKQNREHAIQILMKKARSQCLTETDRLNLQDMLKQRHRNMDDNKTTAE